MEVKSFEQIEAEKLDEEISLITKKIASIGINSDESVLIYKNMAKSLTPIKNKSN